MNNKSLKYRVSSNRTVMFAYFSIITGVVLFSSSEVFSKLITASENYPSPFWISAIRFLIAGLAFTPSFFSGTKFKIKDLGGIFICSIFSVTLAMTCFYQVALMPEFDLSAPLVAIIFCSNPLFIVLLILAFVPDLRFAFRKLSSSLLALAGVVIASVPAIKGFGNSFEGVVFVFIASVLFAIQFPYSRKYIIIYGGKKYLGVLFLFGGLTSLIIAYFFDGPLYLNDISSCIWPMLGYALLSCALGYYFYFHGLKRITNSKSSQIFFLKAALSPVIAFLILGTSFNYWLISGVVIILLGVICSDYPQNNKAETIL